VSGDIASPEPTQPAGDTADGSSGRAGWVRPTAAAVCGVLAVVLLMLSVVAVWARATIFDSATAASVARNAISDPEIQAALAADLADAVTENLRLPATVVDELPPALDRLRPVLRSAVDDLAERAFAAVLDRPRIADLVAGVVTRAHDRAMQLLQGDGLGHGISVVDGEVSINLLPVISRGLAALSDLGVPGLSDIPELAADGDPADQIAQLEAATGRDLPDGFGQLGVYSSERLANAQESVSTAQQLLVVAKRAFWLLLVLTVALFAASILLARDRWVTVLRLGVGAAIGMVLARTAVHRLVADAPDLAARPAGRSLIEIVLADVTPGLLRAAGFVLLVAVAAAAAGLLLRGRRHQDVVLVVAAAVGLAVVVVAGLGIWSLLVGVVLALAVIPVDRYLQQRATAT
jgi:hypothetical protein